MARNRRKPIADMDCVLPPPPLQCDHCQQRRWISHHNKRTVLTLKGSVQLSVPVRVCRNPQCPQFKKPIRSFEEGAIALPKSECGLDLIAFVGQCRYAQFQSIPQIQQTLQQRDLLLCERTVCNLTHRYEELLALKVSYAVSHLEKHDEVTLALDGLQPDKGHEVLWVLRDCRSGQILLARSLLGASQDDLAALIREVVEALPVRIGCVISDGQQSIRLAVRQVLPGVPHQLCQFHYLREAARPIYEADRHAKKELKKRVRGIRPIEHAVADRQDGQAQAVRGYCLAVRSAITDDGRPPLAAPGLRLHERLTAIETSLQDASKKGNCPES